jgi:hypothetical protein
MSFYYEMPALQLRYIIIRPAVYDAAQLWWFIVLSTGGKNEEM